MPAIKLIHITKRWGSFYGVDDLSLDIKDNAFVTLLGPSGCGKTTILRMIAGLETPTEGKIMIGDQVVFDSDAGINVPPNKRKVGFLFQNYALWPNMTVYQNISFGLKNVKEEMAVLDVEAKKASDILRSLSGGRKIRELILECRDKKGNPDAQKAYVKLIDTFGLSMMTAKELYDLKIQDAADPDSAAAEAKKAYEKKLEDRKSRAPRERGGSQRGLSGRQGRDSAEGRPQTFRRRNRCTCARGCENCQNRYVHGPVSGGAFRRTAAACRDRENTGTQTESTVHGRAAVKP